MHEATGRRICRLLFAAFCLVPTLGTMTWALVRHTSLAARQWRAEWQGKATAALHLAAGTLKVGRVENPGPHRFVLHDVSLSDRRQAFQVGPRLFVSLPTVHVSRELDWQQLNVAEASVDFSGLHELASRLGVAFRKGDTQGTRIHVRRLTLERSGKPAFVLHSVQWVSSRKEHSLGGKLSFKLDPDGPRLEVRLVHDFERRSVGYQLNTFQTTLPAWLMEGFLPVTRHLGPDAVFIGSITSTVQPGNHHVHVLGTFEAVDLQRLLAAVPGSYPMEGKAHLKLDFELANTQVTRADVTVSCSPLAGNQAVGKVHTFLVRGAGRLGLLAREFHYPAHVDFCILGMRLHYERGLVTIQGLSDGALLRAPESGKAFLESPQPVTVPVERAVDILFADEAPRTSFSRPSWTTLRWFPLR